MDSAAGDHGILLSSMSENIEAARKWLNESADESRCSIFRVPQGLAGGFAEACRPRIVSIGPYHHGESQLQTLQGYKWRFLHTLLDRTKIRIGNLIDVVAPKEKKIRQCYSESTDNFSGPDLVKMLVLDGCFIVELLRQIAGDVQPDKILLMNVFVLTSIGRDLLRLENQLPYFVLEDLFTTTNVPEGTLSLADLAFYFFSTFLKVSGNVEKRGMHLLDTFRVNIMHWIQQDNYPVDESSSYHMIISASEFRQVGIGFKQRQASPILGIKFDSEHRIIEIPKISIEDPYNCILLNLVAFEQCCGQLDGHINAYVSFLGCLIHTADDAQLLRDCEVISNQGMSNEDVARFFHDICKHIVVNIEGSYLASHFARINKSLEYERAYLCWAQLLTAFHDNRWSALLGLAILVTLVGMIKIVYTMMQYYHPT